VDIFIFGLYYMAILAEDVKRVVISAVEGQHAGLPSSAAQWRAIATSPSIV